MESQKLYEFVESQMDKPFEPTVSVSLFDYAGFPFTFGWRSPQESKGIVGGWMLYKVEPLESEG
jgi:hypothetical protein